MLSSLEKKKTKETLDDKEKVLSITLFIIHGLSLQIDPEYIGFS